MKTVTFRHPFEAKHQPEIHATMLDFRLFGNVHPLMVSVTLVGHPQPGVTTYTVREETKIGGWLKMKPRYDVHVSEPSRNQLIAYQARMMGFMRLHIEISFTAPDAQGQIELLEKVQVSRVPLLTGMFLKIFGEAHAQAFANLREQLGAAKSAEITA
jgi:hypothetical protein